MEYTTFGRTGLEVSRLGYGAAVAGLSNYLGAYNPTEQRDTVIGAIHRAAQLGVNYFDTAPAYGKGTSEEIVGEALASAHCPKPLVVATKVGIWESNARQSIEGSLTRLRRDSVDILQIHGLSITDEQADKALGSGGLVEQMLHLREEGLIRYIGFTTEDNNPAVYRFVRSGLFDSIQLNYNLFYQHPYEPGRPFGSLFEAQQATMGVAAMRVMTSGLMGKFMARVDPHNTTNYAAGLLQFVLSNPLVHVALVGMRSAQKVEQNVAVVNDTEGRFDLKDFFNWYV